jgi:hypothetical protein
VFQYMLLLLPNTDHLQQIEVKLYLCHFQHLFRHINVMKKVTGDNHTAELITHAKIGWLDFSLTEHERSEDMIERLLEALEKHVSAKMMKTW